MEWQITAGRIPCQPETADRGPSGPGNVEKIHMDGQDGQDNGGKNDFPNTVYCQLGRSERRNPFDGPITPPLWGGACLRPQDRQAEAVGGFNAFR